MRICEDKAHNILLTNDTDCSVQVRAVGSRREAQTGVMTWLQDHAADAPMSACAPVDPDVRMRDGKQLDCRDSGMKVVSPTGQSQLLEDSDKMATEGISSFISLFPTTVLAALI